MSVKPYVNCNIFFLKNLVRQTFFSFQATIIGTSQISQGKWLHYDDLKGAL